MDTVVVVVVGEEAGEEGEGTGMAAESGGTEEVVRGDTAPTWTRTEVDDILHT